MKRLLSITLCLVFILTALYIPVSAEGSSWKVEIGKTAALEYTELDTIEFEATITGGTEDDPAYFANHAIYIGRDLGHMTNTGPEVEVISFTDLSEGDGDSEIPFGQKFKINAKLGKTALDITKPYDAYIVIEYEDSDGSHYAYSTYKLIITPESWKAPEIKTSTWAATGQENDTVVRYPKKDEFDWSLVNFATGIHSFTGTFKTDWGTLSMVQKGDKVTGQYPHDDGRIDGTIVDGVLYGYWYESPSFAPPSDAGQIVFVMNKDGKNFTGWWRYGNSGGWTLWSSGTRNEQETSVWASEEAAKADAFGLIPNNLKGVDLTKPITREEFAELAVRLYEVYTGKKADPASGSTFTDCINPEVLKAYELGIVSGVGNNKFEPKALTNREQIATMMKKAASVMKPDGDFSTKGAPSFSDEKQMSKWALENIRFMAKAGFISGMGNNSFSPKGTCTREMAVIIAVKVYEYYKK